MAYSGDPALSGLDAVRFWAQDTGATSLLNDNEIYYVIAFNKLDPLYAPVESAAVVADRIAAKYAGEVSINSDGVSYSGEQLQQKYSELAKELRKTARRIPGQGAGPYIGGQQMGAQFSIGMSDNPEGHSQLDDQSWDQQEWLSVGRGGGAGNGWGGDR